MTISSTSSIVRSRPTLGAGTGADQAAGGGRAQGKGRTFRSAKHLDKLAAEFGGLASRGALGLWRWARALLDVYSAGRLRPRGRMTLRQVGDVIGLAARGKRFSTAWVSRALAAAREWPNPPRTLEERAAFSLRFHGHSRVEEPEKEQDDSNIRLRRVVERLRRAAADAIGLGCEVAAVERFIHAALIAAPDVDEDDMAVKALTRRKRPSECPIDPAARPVATATTRTPSKTTTTTTTTSPKAGPAGNTPPRRPSLVLQAS